MEIFYETMDAMQVMDYLLFGFLGIISYFLRDVHAGGGRRRRDRSHGDRHSVRRCRTAGIAAGAVRTGRARRADAHSLGVQ